MAGTVFELDINQLISNRDELAASISAEYDTWVMARENKRNEWK